MKDTILQNRIEGFRAGGIIIKDNKILLMHQIFKNEEFYTIPGGSWEKGETLEETCKREIMEEFNIEVTVGKLIFLVDTPTRIAFYFECDANSTKIELGGPEKDRMSGSDDYIVEWVKLNRVKELNIIPKPAKTALLKYLETPKSNIFLTS